jgi:hypothetical protein
MRCLLVLYGKVRVVRVATEGLQIVGPKDSCTFFRIEVSRFSCERLPLVSPRSGLEGQAVEKKGVRVGFPHRNFHQLPDGSWGQPWKSQMQDLSRVCKE